MVTPEAAALLEVVALPEAAVTLEATAMLEVAVTLEAAAMLEAAVTLEATPSTARSSTAMTVTLAPPTRAIRATGARTRSATDR